MWQCCLHNHSSICWEACLIDLTMTSIQCTLLMSVPENQSLGPWCHMLNFQPWKKPMTLMEVPYFCSGGCGGGSWREKFVKMQNGHKRFSHHWEWLQNLTAKKKTQKTTAQINKSDNIKAWLLNFHKTIIKFTDRFVVMNSVLCWSYS